MSVISLEEARKKLEKSSTSGSQSEQNTPSGELGQTPTDLDDGTIDSLVRIHKVLFRAWDTGFTTKSEFARGEANIVAIAATEGLITTRLSDEVWGHRWLITDHGLYYMKEIEDAFSGR